MLTDAAMLVSRNVSRTELPVEPVTVEELRVHLRLQTKAHDEHLRELITASRQWIEDAMLWRLLLRQVVVEKFDRFAGEMELRWPAASITSVAYLDPDGDTQTVAATVYELATNHSVSYIRLKYNQYWPTDVRAHEDAVTITYPAGYGSGSSYVPMAIRRALLLHAGGLFRPMDAAPDSVDALLSVYAIHRVL